AEQVGGLAVPLQNTGEADGAGRQLEQVAADVEVGVGSGGLTAVDHAGREGTVDLRGDRRVPAVQVQGVGSVAAHVAQALAQEVVVHGLGQQARTVGFVLVLAVVDAGFPVEAVAKHALRTEGDVVHRLVVDGAGRFGTAELARGEDALQLQEVLGGGVVVVHRGAAGGGAVELVTAGAPELGAAAGLGLGGVVVGA